MKFAVFGVLLGSSFLWAGSGPKLPEILIITNVNIVDMGTGGIAPNLTVVVKDGVIESFLKVAIIDQRPNVRVINGGGKYLVPALWDMNAQLSRSATAGLDNKSLFALYLTNGIVGLREPGRGNGDHVELVRELLDLPAANELHAAGVRDATSLHPRTQFDSIEDVEEIMLACSARETELRARAKEPPVKAAVAGDDPGEAMAPPKPPLAMEVRESYDPQKARELFLKMSDHATWMVPSLVSSEAPIAAFSEDDWETLNDPAYIKKPRAQVNALLEQKAELNRALLLVHDMKSVGVQFLAGTNGPSQDLAPGRSLHRELELLVQSGFTPLDALRSATVNAALYMVKLDKYGVIERGHVADMLLLQGNPLQDIKSLAKIDAVIEDGKYFSRADLDALAAGANRQPSPGTSTAALPPSKMAQ
jgi:hypothetical protein